MNCKQVQKHLDDYRSGLLDNVLIEIIEKHLETCADCRKAMRSEETVSDFLKQENITLSNTSVADTLLKKLDDIDRETCLDPDPDHGRFIDSRFKWLMITALAAGFVLIGFLVIPFDSKPEYHDVGHQTGPRFTWIGSVPFDEPMDSRWNDPVLIGRDLAEITPEKTGEDDPEDFERVIHVLDFGDRNTQSEEELEEDQ
jgi:hypothetical protein